MKKTFAVVIVCIACFAFGYYINSASTDKQLEERYQLGYWDAVKELDEDYSERLKNEKEKSYQSGYSAGFRSGINEAGKAYEKNVEVPKFNSESQEEMYDEIWDEVYERAREDFESEYGVDNDY